MIQRHLNRQGYEVATARDGREALEKVESEHPDLIVLDMMMPYMDGFQVLETLQANPTTQTIPIVLITAKPSDWGWEQSLKDMAPHTRVQNLYKPVDPARVSAAVRLLLEAPGEE